MRLLLYVFILILFLPGCDIINPDEQIPGYVAVEDYSFTTVPGQGTASSNITEVWVYANDNMHGAYSVPSKVPVLTDGTTRITCYAGIRNNGIGTLRIRYPFYAAFDTTVNMQPQSEVSLSPHFTYLDGVDINASRNFEGALGFVPGVNNEGVISQETQADITFEGNGSAEVTLNTDQDYFQFVDSSPFSFQTGNTVFLEMNYSCNNSFTVGCYIVDGSITEKIGVIVLTPTTSDETGIPSWNKVYLDLGALALIVPGADYYKLYIESARYEAENPKVYLDNLKIVKFEE